MENVLTIFLLAILFVYVLAFYIKINKINKNLSQIIIPYERVSRYIKKGATNEEAVLLILVSLEFQMDKRRNEVKCSMCGRKLGDDNEM